MLATAFPEYLADDADPWDLHSATAHIVGYAAESGRSVEEEAQDFIEARRRKWRHGRLC
jgi:hypothetical protein